MGRRFVSLAGAVIAILAVVPALAAPQPYRVVHASPVARSESAVSAVIGRIDRSLRTTRYVHSTHVDEAAGRFDFDCSGMATWVLARSAPAAHDAVMRRNGRRRPVASDYYDVIAQTPTSNAHDGWLRVAHVRDLKPGDLIAWRRPQAIVSSNTGHVLFVVAVPQQVDGEGRRFLVRVADATSIPHAMTLARDDTRAGSGTAPSRSSSIVRKARSSPTAGMASRRASTFGHRSPSVARCNERLGASERSKPTDADEALRAAMRSCPSISRTLGVCLRGRLAMTPLEEDITFVVESVGRRGVSVRLELIFDRFAVVVPDAEALAATYDALEQAFDERVLSRFFLFERELPKRLGTGRTLTLSDEARERAKVRVRRRIARRAATTAPTHKQIIRSGCDVLLVDDESWTFDAIAHAMALPTTTWLRAFLKPTFEIGVLVELHQLAEADHDRASAALASRIHVVVDTDAAAAVALARPFLSILCPAAKAFGPSGVVTAIARPDSIGACDVAIIASSWERDAVLDELQRSNGWNPILEHPPEPAAIRVLLQEGCILDPGCMLAQTTIAEPFVA
jgi:hypothetical protein